MEDPTLEWIITLHNHEDLEDFYNDMETPGGDLYIPDRAVDLQLRRPISRNTHYMLTPEEVIELENDPRVLGVESKALLDLVVYELNVPLIPKAIFLVKSAFQIIMIIMISTSI